GEQLVHRLHRHPGAGGDAALARGLDELGLRALLRGHRVDDALDAPELLVVLELRGVDLADELRGQLVDERGDSAHLLHLRDLLLEVLEVEALAFLDLLGDALRLLEVDLGVGLLDQRQDVAHAEDARRHALGMERLQPGQLLAHARELDRLAGDVANREGRAPAAIAVELGEDHAGERQALVNARATLTASWPCIASTTKSVSTGWSAACSSAISRIISSSTARRPAVSTRSTSW